MNLQQRYALVVQGNLVDARQVVKGGWLAMNHGKIVARGHGEAPAAEKVVDARGKWVFPGVIDGQVHAGSQQGQEGLGHASRAAAAGGVTVMVDMPYDSPKIVASRDILDEKIAEVERDCHVDVALFGTVQCPDGLDAIPGLIDGGVCAFKFSTFEAAPGRFPRVEEDDLMEVFRRIKPSGLVCSVHNQMQELTWKNIRRMQENHDTGWDAFLRAHTPLIENLATALIYEIGAETGARTHVVHVSTSRGFELYRMYQQAGYPVSIETCVQYLMLNHEEHTRRFGANTKHYPPIRPKAESELLWQHIAQGNCTFVSSDHVSWGAERKCHASIFENTSGGPGLETLLPALWTGCEQRGITPTRVAQLLCYNPARHFLLDDRKGGFDVGMDGDFVILNPKTYCFDPANSLSAVTWSNFEGMEFTVQVEETWCRGQPVYIKGDIVNQAGYGQFLRPSNHSGGDSSRPAK